MCTIKLNAAYLNRELRGPKLFFFPQSDRMKNEIIAVVQQLFLTRHKSCQKYLVISCETECQLQGGERKHQLLMITM